MQEIFYLSFFWFVLGLALGTLGIWGTAKIFRRLAILDFPERYGLNRAPIPYPLGTTFVVGASLLVFLDERFWSLWIFLGVLGMVSFWDDRRHIPAILRLLIHVLLGIFLFWQGFGIFWVGDPFHATNFDLYDFSPWLSALVTVIWIVGIQNAMNWFDGTVGLTPSVSGVGFLILGLLGVFRPELFFDPSHTSVTFLSFGLAGICLGMVYLLWRGGGILGDTGSQVMGGMLAVVAIASGAKIATTILVLILPLLDFIFVIFRRIFLDKVSPLRGDRKHLHHLLQRSIGGGNTLILLTGISLLFGLAAVFLSGILKLILIISGGGIFLLWRFFQNKTI